MGKTTCHLADSSIIDGTPKLAELELAHR